MLIALMLLRRLSGLNLLNNLFLFPEWCSIGRGVATLYTPNFADAVTRHLRRCVQSHLIAVYVWHPIVILYIAFSCFHSQLSTNKYVIVVGARPLSPDQSRFGLK